MALTHSGGSVDDVLRFWFGTLDDDGAADDGHRAVWFTSSVTMDRRCREEFGADLERAARGELDGWAATPRGRLALIVLLDQLSRNVHRDTARAFEQDQRALALCRDGIERGLDRPLHPVERVFFYMPLQHAEDRDAQRRAVELFEALLGQAPAAHRSMFEEFLDYARRHRAIVERFGRFPHRNAVLGRRSTPEEVAFLASPEAPF